MVKQYYLMNKDDSVIKFDIIEEQNQRACLENVEMLSDSLPIGLVPSQLINWLKNRKAPKHRANIRALLDRYGCNSLQGYLNITHALSLNDTFWVRGADDDISWRDVSLYTNDFNEIIAQSAFEGIQGDVSLSSTSPEFSTDGAYAKCWIKSSEGQIFLIKAGSKDGLEPYSEYYASQIAKMICKSSVNYDMVVYRNCIAGKCAIFTNEYVGFAAAYKLINSSSYKELLNYFSSIGQEDEFRRMLVLDALILNIDRHTGNYGCLIDNRTQEIIEMAPMFDHNRSLLYNMKDFELKYYETIIEEFSPRIGNNFIEVAKEALTDDIIKDLKEMSDFSFTRHNKYNLPDERLELLELIVRRQVEMLLR